MFETQVDHQMILEINNLLHKNNLHYTVKAYSGCAACGLHLLFEEDDHRDECITLINTYLYKKWMKIVQNPEDKHMLYVQSIY